MFHCSLEPEAAWCVLNTYCERRDCRVKLWMSPNTTNWWQAELGQRFVLSPEFIGVGEAQPENTPAHSSERCFFVCLGVAITGCLNELSLQVQSYSCWVCTGWQNIILIFRCFLWNGEGSCWGKFILMKFLGITLSFARLQLCLCSIVYFKIERIQYIVEKERVTAIIQEFKNLGRFLLLHLSVSICVGLVLDGAFFNPVRA